MMYNWTSVHKFDNVKSEAIIDSQVRSHTQGAFGVAPRTLCTRTPSQNAAAHR